MTAVNPVYMSPDLGSLVEITFGAAQTLASIDRVTVRWRSGTTEIPGALFTSGMLSDALRLVVGPGWTSVGSYAFSDWSSATSLTLPASLTSVGSYAFRGWSSATSLTLPASLTSVGTSAFSDWSSATSLTLPASLTSVGTYAFRGWSSATSLTYAEGTTAIATYTNNTSHPFAGWDALTAIDLPSTLTTIGGHLTYSDSTALDTVIVRATTPPTISATALANVPATANIYVPDAAVAAYQAAANWSDRATYIVALSTLP